jgi:ATP-dependent helicase HrpB
VVVHLLALHSTAFHITLKPCSAHTNTLKILYVIQPSLFDTVANDDIQSLPIYSILNDVQESLEQKPNLLLEAAPGAGKTTIVPLLLTSTGGKTLVIEPRRIATRSAAQRMSSLLNEQVGQSVGYSIRGETRSCSTTSVLVMTDGVLLNMLRQDPELNDVKTVILDEFHERGVGSDTCLALLREVQMNYRNDLKIVVMSATLLGSADGEETTGTKLKKVLGEECNMLKSEGRQFPITVKHALGRTPLRSLVRDAKLLVKTIADAIEEGFYRAPGKQHFSRGFKGRVIFSRMVHH